MAFSTKQSARNLSPDILSKLKISLTKFRMAEPLRKFQTQTFDTTRKWMCYCEYRYVGPSKPMPGLSAAVR